MASKKDFTKALLVLVVIFVVAALLLTGLNGALAPIIEAQGASQMLAPLLAVMPEASGFDTLYDVNDSASSALVDVPGTVQGIYGETGGLGYAVKLSTTEGYTGEAIELTMAVDAEGKISGIELNSYPETKDFGADYPQTYLGQDSTLADAAIVAGVTYSSSAFKNAVADGFAALVNNGLIGAGVKSDDQVLMELMPVAYPGIAAAGGVAQFEEAEVNSGSIVKAYKALNGTGYAFILNDGSANYLGVCTLAGGAKILAVDGSEIDNAALIDEIRAYTEANAEALNDKNISKLQRMLGEGAEITALPMELYSSVTGVYQISFEGSQYYGICARSFGYSNMPQVVHFIFDENGAIVSMSCDELIFFKEYFTAYTLDEPSYKEGFAGLTADSWTGEQALISGATMTSNAMKAATDDAFAAFAAIN